MLGAVLDGQGLQGLAELAWEEGGCPVSIELPGSGLAASAPDPAIAATQTAAIEIPIVAGGDPIGTVRVYAGQNGDTPEVDCEEVGRAAALAAVAQLAVTEARDEVEHDLRASLLEDLRSGATGDILRRAARLGCSPTGGGIALVSEILSSKPRGAVGLIETEWPGALAELLGDRVYAILPVSGDSANGVERGRRLITRLRAHGPSAMSSFYLDPGELHLAVREAELVLEVVRSDESLAEQIEIGAGDGVYRLLFRALISHPEEVRSFYEDTVAPLVTYDEQYRSDLLGTLEAYLANDCNMNATARNIYAHRHTVAYRLDRIRELSGLDPASSSDRERLGLGIKAFRILGPAAKH